MKVFVLVWLIVWAILVHVGWVWYYFDRKNEKHKKAPIALLVIGNLMMAIYFLVLLPLMRR